MRLSVVLLTLSLAGCAGSAISEGAIPQAAASQSLALDKCSANARNRIYMSATEYVGCIVAARQQFVAEIKLTKIEVYNAYRDRIMLVAGDFDAGNVPFEEFDAKFREITKDFTDALVALYYNDRDNEARRRAAALAFAAGVQNASQSYQNSYRPPTTCTSQAIGARTVTTSCY